MSDFLLWLFLFALGTVGLFLMILGAMSLGKVPLNPPQTRAFPRGAACTCHLEGGAE